MDISFDEGELVWLDFSPQSGKEQAGKRPAVVLSTKTYNLRSGLMLVCPITSNVKGYPFEVPIPKGGKIQGVILVDHLKSVDWKARQPEYVERVSIEVLHEVRAKLKALLQIP